MSVIALYKSDIVCSGIDMALRYLLVLSKIMFVVLKLLFEDIQSGIMILSINNLYNVHFPHCRGF